MFDKNINYMKAIDMIAAIILFVGGGNAGAYLEALKAQQFK